MPADVLEFQMRIAVREATDLAFVPPPFRKFAAPSPDMSARRSYLAAAFNARPFGMPAAAELVRPCGVRTARRIRQSRLLADRRRA